MLTLALSDLNFPFKYFVLGGIPRRSLSQCILFKCNDVKKDWPVCSRVSPQLKSSINPQPCNYETTVLLDELQCLSHYNGYATLAICEMLRCLFLETSIVSTQHAQVLPSQVSQEILQQ